MRYKLWLIFAFLLVSTQFMYSNQLDNVGQPIIRMNVVSQAVDGPFIQNFTYAITNYTDANDAITIFCECSMLSNETEPAWQEHYLGNFLANRFEWDGEPFNYTYSINPYLTRFNITVILYDDMNNTATEHIQIEYDEGKELVSNSPPEGFPDLTETSNTSVYVGQNATMIWYVMDNVLGLEVLINGIVVKDNIFVNETPHVLRYMFTPQEETVYHFSVRCYLEGTPFETSSSLFVLGGFQQLMALSVPVTSSTTSNGHAQTSIEFPPLLALVVLFGLLGALAVTIFFRRR
ncbi:MAG: hypothetical protein ACFFFC_17785 [Candidatus Thorarchaeota archaeon]